jgi:hypothetical protein
MPTCKGTQLIGTTQDGAKRVTMIQRYPSGKNNAEDTCQRVTYAYDANVINSACSQHVAGRLATAQYSAYMAGHPANLDR